MRWRMSTYGVVKVNVHGYFTEEALPNCNRSGIGAVIHNHRGKLLKLYGGSLGIEERRTNEIYAMLQGLIRAYLDEHEVLELETDNVAAHWEWDNSLVNGVPPKHEFVTPQMNTRKLDENWVLSTRPIDEDSNVLARYLAMHGAANHDRMVIYSIIFGRIREIWSHDMGLGPVGGQYVPVYEEDLEAGVINEEVVVEDEVMVEDFNGHEENGK